MHLEELESKIKEALKPRKEEIGDVFFQLCVNTFTKYIEIKNLKEQKTKLLNEYIQKEKERILKIVSELDLKVPKFDIERYKRLTSEDHENDVVSYFFENKLRVIEKYNQYKWLMHKIYFNEENMPLLKIVYLQSNTLVYSFYKEGTENVLFSMNDQSKKLNDKDFDFLKIHLDDLYILKYFDEKGELKTENYTFKPSRAELSQNFYDGYPKERFFYNGSSIDLRWKEDKIVELCIYLNQDFDFILFKLDINGDIKNLEIDNVFKKR